jgi:hypothetical protein
MKKLFTFFLVVSIAISVAEESVDSFSLKATKYYSSRQAVTDDQFQSAGVLKFLDADAMGFLVSPDPSHDYLTIKFSTTKKMAAITTYDDSGKSVTRQAIQNQLISS